MADAVAGKTKDFVIAAGITASIHDFIRIACDDLGIVVRFEGEGVNEKSIVEKCHNSQWKIEVGQPIIEINPYYFRPTEVDHLIGDATKAKEKLGWVPKYSLNEMIAEMLANDLQMFV